jgi:hypothetical protein
MGMFGRSLKTDLPKAVIAGLDPAIQAACKKRRFHAAVLDRRVGPGDDSLKVELRAAAQPDSNWFFVSCERR